MTIKKNDFIELEFIGKANNEVFDSNIEKEVKKINPEAKAEPLILAVGQDMVVKGFDKALEGKEVGKKYTVKISQEEGYGKRFPNLVKTMPLKVFTQQQIRPEPGMTLALDQNLVKIISVSGGRVIADFNNPLAGKELEYEFTIKRKLEDINEKVNALQIFFFRNKFEFEIKDKKLIFKVDDKIAPLINMFKEQFKNLLSLDIETKAPEKPKTKEVISKDDNKTSNK